ncbi:Aste57867_15938 [Aphanomyces stellatus]|uniref:Aste57867_15938 protein n=1 Tax=Aphanomyces stellatus TaxID=120398 RepID=A0A485L493_9STRA|nr:hypothetical protein As57867_015882 [Aphanomyces stellatus]VFT92724.1 Aste57867_15938 [Aphanomyces stellatus]
MNTQDNKKLQSPPQSPPVVSSTTSPAVVVQVLKAPSSPHKLKPTPLSPPSNEYPELDCGVNGVDHNGMVIGHWKQDLFGCIHSCFPNTLMSVVCPCVSVAQIAHRMGLTRYSRALLLFGAVYLICTICYLAGTAGGRVIAILVGVVMWLVLYRMRAAIRTAFQIPGSVLGDVCATLACSFCSLSQMAAHVESYEVGRCTFGPKAVLPGYHV